MAEESRTEAAFLLQVMPQRPPYARPPPAAPVAAVVASAGDIRTAAADSLLLLHLVLRFEGDIAAAAAAAAVAVAVAAVGAAVSSCAGF